MKKAILAVLLIAVVVAAALLLIGIASPGSATVAGNGAALPGYGARLVAGLKARMTSGKAEIHRSVEAKKNVKSFRMKTILKMHPGQALETLVEVSCPDRERFTTTIGEKSFHAVRIGNKAYVEQKDGGWSVQETEPAGWSPCGSDPGEPAPWAIMNEGRDLSVVMGRMADNIEARRGLFVGTPEGNCQEWLLDVKVPGGTGSSHGVGSGNGHGATGLRYTLCMDSARHLPLIISMGSGGMVTQYSDWNKPIQIDAPSVQAAANQGARSESQIARKD